METDDIERLFNVTCNLLNEPERGRREWWIFQQVFGNTPEALAALRTFLKDVRTCPPEVITFCQELLAPKALSKAAE